MFWAHGVPGAAGAGSTVGAGVREADMKAMGEVRAMVCSGVRRQPSHQKGQPACGRGSPLACPCSLPSPTHGHADSLQGWCPDPDRGRGGRMSG